MVKTTRGRSEVDARYVTKKLNVVLLLLFFLDFCCSVTNKQVCNLNQREITLHLIWFSLKPTPSPVN